MPDSTNDETSSALPVQAAPDQPVRGPATGTGYVVGRLIARQERRFAWHLMSLAAILVLLMALIVIGLIMTFVRRTGEVPPEVQAASAAASADAAAQSGLKWGWVDGQLAIAATHVGDTPVKSLTLSTKSDTVFSTCADAATLQNYRISDGAVTADGTAEIDSCVSGFALGGVDTNAISSAVYDATNGIQQPVTVQIFSVDPVTTVISVSVNGGLAISYDVDGTRLESPIKE